MKNFTALTDSFWQQRGTLQDFVDFMLCEIDPIFSRQRLIAQVVDVIDETPQTKTFVLRPSKRWTGFKPGQYVNIEVDINGVRQRRNYSISSSPEYFTLNGLISITVKKIEGGRVSSHLHQHLIAGDTLSFGQAAGEFICEQLSTHMFTESQVTTFESPKPPLFIAAGSGITPIKSMLEAFCSTAPNQSLRLIVHANRSDELIFADQLAQMSGRLSDFNLVTRFTETDGLINAEQLLNDCPDIASRTIYLCGPQGFMNAVKGFATELGVAAADIRQESFGSPLIVNPSLDNAHGEVSFSKSGKVVQSNGKKTLLELAEAAGLNPKYGCRSGICHECKCTKSKGAVFNTLTGAIVPEEQTQIQACISIPLGDLAVTTW